MNSRGVGIARAGVDPTQLEHLEYELITEAIDPSGHPHQLAALEQSRKAVCLPKCTRGDRPSTVAQL